MLRKVRLPRAKHASLVGLPPRPLANKPAWQHFDWICSVANALASAYPRVLQQLRALDLPADVADDVRGELRAWDEAWHAAEAARGDLSRHVKSHMPEVARRLRAIRRTWEHDQDLDQLLSELSVVADEAYQRLMQPTRKPHGTWRGLEVHRGSTVAVLDGREYRLRSLRDSKFLWMLFSAHGQPVKATTLQTACGRPDRIYAKLPEPLKAVVEPPGRGRTGYRLR